MVLLHNSESFLNFFLGRLLCFLLKSVGENNEIALIEKTEYPENIAPLLNSYFVESVSPRQVLEVCLGDISQFLDKTESPNDFVFYGLLLLNEKTLEVALVEDDCSFVMELRHFSDIQKLSESATIIRPFLMQVEENPENPGHFPIKLYLTSPATFSGAKQGRSCIRYFA